MKLPRDLSSSDLIKALAQFEYSDRDRPAPAAIDFQDCEAGERSAFGSAVGSDRQL